MRDHWAHARFAWNLAVEQHSWWRKDRKGASRFCCVACGFQANADVNAAMNIARGHRANARGADRVAGAMNREPQLSLLAG
jgi:putative transposase